MDDHYFKSKNNGGYAAWPLHSPARPEHGQWTWLHIRSRSHRFQQRFPTQLPLRIRFIRPMTEDEINSVCRQYMVWGMKLSDHPWALVQGRRGGTAASSYTPAADTRRSVGV